MSETPERSETLRPMDDDSACPCCEPEAYEWSSYLDRLVRDGFRLPCENELDDEDLSRVLWELLETLYDRYGVVLRHTDHLSDRELYRLLVEELLTEPEPELPEDLLSFTFVDTLDGWSDEDLANLARYYLSDEEREDWADFFGPDEMPPRQDPPFDRDRRLMAWTEPPAE